MRRCRFRVRKTHSPNSPSSHMSFARPSISRASKYVDSAYNAHSTLSRLPASLRGSLPLVSWGGEFVEPLGRCDGRIEFVFDIDPSVPIFPLILKMAVPVALAVCLSCELHAASMQYVQQKGSLEVSQILVDSGQRYCSRILYGYPLMEKGCDLKGICNGRREPNLRT